MMDVSSNISRGFSFRFSHFSPFFLENTSSFFREHTVIFLPGISTTIPSRILQNLIQKFLKYIFLCIFYVEIHVSKRQGKYFMNISSKFNKTQLFFQEFLKYTLGNFSNSGNSLHIRQKVSLGISSQTRPGI